MATLITFLLDKSGSMQSRKAATLEAFGAYIHGLRADFEQNGGDAILFSLYQFDSQARETTAINQPITRVEPLNEQTYQPRGGTPLIDAAYETILDVEKTVRPGDKVVVCIQTDGEENSSRRYTWDQLRRKISEKQEMGWQFNFMGAGIDAYKQSAMMGLNAAQTVSYNDDLVSTARAFAATASNASEFRRGARAEASYTSFQKASIGDQFDPAKDQKPVKVDDTGV